MLPGLRVFLFLFLKVMSSERLQHRTVVNEGTWLSGHRVSLLEAEGDFSPLFVQKECLFLKKMIRFYERYFHSAFDNYGKIKRESPRRRR